MTRNTDTGAAAAASSAPTTFRPLYFTAQRGPSGDSLILSSNAYPDKSIPITSEELRTLHWFIQYFMCQSTRKNEGLIFQTRRDKNVHVTYDVLMTIFCYAFGDIKRFATRQYSVPVQSLIPSEFEELESLALLMRVHSTNFKSLALLSPVNSTQKNKLTSFFDYKLGHLSNASLNADLETVKRIIAKTKLEDLRVLLSNKTTAIITHLGFDRTGSPLQMALYSNDEAMFKLLADQMTPAEVQHQCKEIFDRYDAADYTELCDQLKTDAEELCRELPLLFADGALDDSERQYALNNFNINLNQYVMANPVHNPYILQRLFEIYDQLSYFRSHEYLISQKAIGPAQKLSSAQWLLHYAQGIYCLSENPGAKTRPREFSCYDSDAPVDIRSPSVFFSLGVRSCIDISRRANQPRVIGRTHPWGKPAEPIVPAAAPVIKIVIEKKQQAFEILCAPSATAAQSAPAHNSAA